jgi:hypothetical protein
MEDYRRLYGLKGKAQIYDNFCRGGEYFAYTGRDRDLWKEVECIFNERGTPVSRITVYDYLWNPEAYDEARSLKLAARELSGRDPALYKAMLDYVTYYNKNRDFATYPSRAEVAARLPEIDRTMKAKFEALEPLLDKSALARETNLRFEFWGPEAPRSSYEPGEHTRLRRRLEFEPYSLAYRYREARVAPAAGEMKIDGALDEAAWKGAKPFGDFSKAAWGLKDPPEDLASLKLPPEERTVMRLLYTPTHLYIGIEFTYAQKPVVPAWAAKIWERRKPGEQVNFAWRIPCFEIMLDDAGRREHYYHLIGNIAGLSCTGLHKVGIPRKSGGFWRPDWRFKYTLGDKSGVFEASIPFKDFAGKAPEKGAVWGWQVFRSKFGKNLGLFSGTYEDTRELGRIVFD